MLLEPMTIRKYWVYYFFVVSLVVYVYAEVYSKRKNEITVRAVELQNGWGYDVLIGGNPYIHQKQIPGCEGNITFQSKEEALKVGNLVKQKILLKKGLPAVSMEELDSLQIKR